MAKSFVLCTFFQGPREVLVLNLPKNHFNSNSPKSMTTLDVLFKVRSSVLLRIARISSAIESASASLFVLKKRKKQETIQYLPNTLGNYLPHQKLKEILQMYSKVPTPPPPDNQPAVRLASQKALTTQIFLI